MASTILSSASKARSRFGRLCRKGSERNSRNTNPIQTAPGERQGLFFCDGFSQCLHRQAGATAGGKVLSSVKTGSLHRCVPVSFPQRAHGRSENRHTYERHLSNLYLGAAYEKQTDIALLAVPLAAPPQRPCRVKGNDVSPGRSAIVEVVIDPVRWQPSAYLCCNLNESTSGNPVNDPVLVLSQGRESKICSGATGKAKSFREDQAALKMSPSASQSSAE